MIQFAIGKEALGDAHKKMRQHKQALSRYEEALADVENARRSKDTNEAQLLIQLENLSHKVKLKIAMSHYY